MSAQVRKSLHVVVELGLDHGSRSSARWWAPWFKPMVQVLPQHSAWQPPQPQPQQVQQQPAGTPAQRAQNSGSVQQKLTTGGVENKCSQEAETIWQSWLCEGTRAVSGQDCKVTWQRCWKPAEAKGGQGAQPILGDSDNLAEVKGKKSRRASRELHSTLVQVHLIRIRDDRSDRDGCGRR